MCPRPSRRAPTTVPRGSTYSGVCGGHPPTLLDLFEVTKKEEGGGVCPPPSPPSDEVWDEPQAGKVRGRRGCGDHPNHHHHHHLLPKKNHCGFHLPTEPCPLPQRTQVSAQGVGENGGRGQGSRDHRIGLGLWPRRGGGPPPRSLAGEPQAGKVRGRTGVGSSQPTHLTLPGNWRRGGLGIARTLTLGSWASES